MNVFDVLKQDHERVRQLFARIEETQAGAQQHRESLFRQLKEELIAHSHAEERVFYPLLKKQGDDEVRQEIDDGIDEHHEVEMLLKRADGMDSGSEEWIDCIHDIKQLVEHHVAEEEGEIFKAAQQMLRESQIDELGDDVKSSEQEEKDKLH